MKIKIITCIYNNLFGTEYGGRPNREWHYKWSLLSLLKMNSADFVCYTSSKEIEDLKNFFYVVNNINEEKIKFVNFELTDNYFKDLIFKYKNIDEIKKSDRCIEIQYMKFMWFLLEDMTYDYYYWFDAGLSHSGLIPLKYLDYPSPMRCYYESSLFNNAFLENLLKFSNDKFTLVGKENVNNFWSGTVNPIHYTKYDNTKHIIGGFFGGKKETWNNIVEIFKNSLFSVTEHDKKIYFEENIMSLMYFNNKDLFNLLEFDIWWHEDEKMGGIDDMKEYLKDKKSFYKIIEDLN